MKTIYFNGTILTMEPDRLYVQAVVTENGRILFAGAKSEAETLCDRMTKRVDLEGAAMLPAFIDAHSHLSQAASNMLQVNLEGCISLEELGERIRAYVTVTKPKEAGWIIGKGYDHNVLESGRHPSRAFLDRCCPEYPVILQHASGHVGVMNTPALRQLGIDESTEAPSGGRIDYAEGYLEENAFFYYMKLIPMADLSALMGAFAGAQEMYASYGITTIQEGYAVKEMIPLYQYLVRSGQLRLDVVAYADAKENAPFYTAFETYADGYHEHLRLGGYKMLLDGSPQGRTAWMRTPYLPEAAGQQEASYCGYPCMTDEEVTAAVRAAAIQGKQILAHCNGDAAADQYLRAITEVSRTCNVAATRPVMIHAQLLGRDQLERVKQEGVIPSFFVAHVYHWGDTHIRNFGLQRASQISPAASALEHGILFTFHQDTPVLAPDMLETVWCAVARRTKNGVLLGQDEGISAYEALKAITVNAAYQYGEEADKGSIASGKRADFVILSADPLTVPTDEIRNIAVLRTIMEGIVIYEGQ